MEDINDISRLDLEDVIASMKGITEDLISRYDISGLDREDLRQEAYIALADAMKSYDAAKGASFSSYARACMENRILDAARKASNNRNRGLNGAQELDETMEYTGPSPDFIVQVRDDLRKAQECISEQLSDNERFAILLWLQGNSVREIASQAGAEPRSVSNALARARKKIRKYIGP